MEAGSPVNVRPLSPDASRRTTFKLVAPILAKAAPKTISTSPPSHFVEGQCHRPREMRRGTAVGLAPQPGSRLVSRHDRFIEPVICRSGEHRRIVHANLQSDPVPAAKPSISAAIVTPIFRGWPPTSGQEQQRGRGKPLTLSRQYGVVSYRCAAGSVAAVASQLTDQVWLAIDGRLQNQADCSSEASNVARMIRLARRWGRSGHRAAAMFTPAFAPPS